MDSATEQGISSYRTVQNDDTRGISAKPLRGAKLLTVSYSCFIIVQPWLVFGLTVGYTSPVLDELEGNGNSSAPLDKLTYQDLFSVSELAFRVQCILVPIKPAACSYNTQTHTHTHVQGCMHTCAHTHGCASAHSYIYTRTYMQCIQYTYTHVHVYMQCCMCTHTEL